MKARWFSGPVKGWALLAALAVGLYAGVGLGKSGTNTPPKLVIQSASINRDIRAPISFSPVVRRIAPSVVNIYSTMTIHERATPNPFFDDPFFRRFFGDQLGPQQEQHDHRAQSLGSGVIISPDGYILTANHVIEGADTVKVALESGEREFDAKVIGADPPTDVAVLKIDVKTNLASAVLGDSDKLEVGDVVLAVGNPFGVGQTVTLGIISALGRSGFGINGYENYIQTDAAINPGNSGGALVDAEGRLVGINTAIISRTGGFQGVGFAVPVNMARFAMDRLITYGKVTRGFLGVNIQALTPDLAKEFHLPDQSGGVLVGGVTPGSPAAKAGVQDGDLIMEFQGQKVSDPRTLQLLVAQTPPGSKVNLRLQRSVAAGKPADRTLTVTLGTLPQEAVASANGSGSNGGNHQSMDALDGVEVTDLDAGVRRQLGLPRSVHGALVVDVEQDSQAAEAGLHAGDVILEINHQTVRNADDAVALSGRSKGDHVLLRVWSGGATGATGAAGTHYIVVENTHGK